MVNYIHKYKGIVKLPMSTKPKDLTIGSLSVSVLAKQNKLLAPKVVEKAKGVKENWLRGRITMAATATRRKGLRAAPIRMERKAWGSGARTFS